MTTSGMIIHTNSPESCLIHFSGVYISGQDSVHNFIWALACFKACLYFTIIVKCFETDQCLLGSINVYSNAFNYAALMYINVAVLRLAGISEGCFEGQVDICCFQHTHA